MIHNNGILLEYVSHTTELALVKCTLKSQKLNHLSISLKCKV